jgi:hypothetical protein
LIQARSDRAAFEVNIERNSPRMCPLSARGIGSH